MTDQPNVLLFMLDQVPAHVLRPDSPCRTPNLDRVIRRGVRVDRGYTPSPICTPARASFMTGLLPHNHGATQVHLPPKSDPLVAQLHKDKVHWAQRLNDAGYQTGHWGKWHVDYWHNVNRFGWEQWDPGINLHPPEVNRLWSVPQPNPNPGYGAGANCCPTDTPLEERPQWRHYEGARRFINDVLPSGDPWACALSFSGPHSRKDGHIDLVNEYLAMDLPLPESRRHNLEDRPELYRLAQKPWRGMTDEDHRKIRACHYAAVEEHDRMFGLVMDQVEEAGQLDDTIIIFVSDHGDALGAHGVYTKIMFSHEPVYNIPMVLAGPGIAKGEVTRARVGLHDLCPTILELTGCDPIDGLDGRSAATLLAAPRAEEEQWTAGYAENYGTQLLFTQRLRWEGDWKLVYNGFGKSELYNLAEDPEEMTNRIDDPAAQKDLKRMAKHLWRTARDTGDIEIQGTPPCFRFFPYGPGILNE